MAPPRDSDGVVEPHDHSEIENDDKVLRYIPRKEWIVEKPCGGLRLSTAACTSSSDKYKGWSVGHKPMVLYEHGTIRDWLPTDAVGYAYIVVGELRGEGVKVGWDPLEKDQTHCNAWNIGSSKRRQKRVVSNKATIVKV